MANTLLSIFFAIIAYTMLNIGFVLQKKGASELPKIENQGFLANIKNFLSSKIWLMGLILTGIQWLFYMLALDFGSLAVVAPILGWGVIVLVLFSYFYLHEKISRAEVSCIGIIIGGIVLVGLTSPDTQQELTTSTVFASLANPTTIVFLICLAAITVIPVILSWKNHFWRADIIFGLCSGFAATLAAVFSNALVAFVSLGNIGDSLGLALAASPFWAFLFILLIGNAGSMVFQQIAYQRGKVSLINTLYTVVCVIMPVFAGAVVYGEWALVNPDFAALRIGCILIVAVGAGALSYFNSKNQDRERSKPERTVE